MYSLSPRLNTFILKWFEQNSHLFCVYDEPQFRLEDADTSYHAFREHFKKHGTIPMWYDNNEDNIFGSTEVNAKFRAWHDYIHVSSRNDFSLQGEIMSFRIQRRALPVEWRWERALMEAEIIGQGMHYSSSSEVIPSQRQFALNYIKTFIA
jgi:hypothetical protein